MSRVKCKLLYHALGRHIQHLFTGFKMLGDSGMIDVTQERCSPSIGSVSNVQYLKDSTNTHLRVELTNNNNKLMLYFDNHDAKEIDKENLRKCDLYFKRSFSRQYITECHFEYKDKIYPIGLNYVVFPNNIDILSLRRNISLATGVRKLLSGTIASIDTRNKIRFHPRLRNLHSLPIYSLPPKVLFMVTAYNPYDTPSRPKEKIQERIHSNEIRAACVRILRKELGNMFYGGFVHNKFTIENYKDVLVDDPANTNRENYLRIVEKFPICVATTGLHGSIGGKFAEYVAFSKAIVSEKLHYEIPGPFGPNQNYLEFSTPEECVEQSIKLLNDRDLRNRLITNNSVYYQHYVKPDMLVFNALSIAIEQWK